MVIGLYMNLCFNIINLYEGTFTIFCDSSELDKYIIEGNLSNSVLFCYLLISNLAL